MIKIHAIADDTDKGDGFIVQKNGGPACGVDDNRADPKGH